MVRGRRRGGGRNAGAVQPLFKLFNDSMALAALVALLGGSLVVAGAAAGALHKLSSGSELVCERIVQTGALRPLVSLLATLYYNAAGGASGALSNLALDRDARCERIVQTGALRPLVALLGCESNRIVMQATGALSNLARGSVSRTSMINELDAASSLRPLLHHSSSSLAVKAAGTLHVLGRLFIRLICLILALIRQGLHQTAST